MEKQKAELAWSDKTFMSHAESWLGDIIHRLDGLINILEGYKDKEEKNAKSWRDTIHNEIKKEILRLKGVRYDLLKRSEGE